jgi:hypothetical protein
MEDLIAYEYFGLFSILFYFVAKLCRNTKSSNSWGIQIFFVFLFSLLTTMVVTFHDEAVPMKISDQSGVIENSASFETNEYQQNVDSILRQFTLLNIVKDAPSEETTKRKDITQLLKYINDSLEKNQSYIDLVILNIYFDTVSYSSEEMITEIDRLAQVNKIILAFDDQKCIDKKIYNLSRKEIFASTTYTPEDYAFVKYPFFNRVLLEQPYLMPTLPYLSYQKLMGIKTDTIAFKSRFFEYTFYQEKDYANKVSHILKEFVPILYPELLQNPDSDNKKNFILDINKNISYSRLEHHLKSKHNKSIIFIGQFNTEKRDLKSTSFGMMNGETILLSTIVNLLLGQHKNTIPLLAVLFIGFLVIYSVIFFKSIYGHKLNQWIQSKAIIKWKTSILKKHKHLQGLEKIINAIFFDNLHYWLLLILYSITYRYLQRIIIIMPLLVFLLLLSTFLETYSTNSKGK